ncbi:MAG: response regulator transcription factor [Candidatus Gastranaerophilales bacterium]|nr:response regulator transcription factor [Candidatus Gastranaerophilales bacterium]
MYKILIAEDHALIRFGLKTAFESKSFIDEIYETSCAEDALNVIKNNHIDAVIMDLGLPGMNGIEASKEIKAFNKDIKIIILTSHNNEQEVLDSIKAGARAYCSKDINPETLTEIVYLVLQGALWFDAKVAEVILNALSSDKNQKDFDFKEDYNLTDREKEVLEYICEGLNNSEISKLLDVSVNTVKVHVSSIIQKLGVEDRTQAAVKAFKSLRK